MTDRAERRRKTQKKSIAQSSPPPTNAAADERDELGSGGLFPIVGVGASAGGLEAFTQLLAALPRHTGLGFVLVQHLDPDHESALTEILSRATSLPVREITNDERVRVDHVYVIPPDTDLTIADGVLKIQRRQRTGGPHRSIDTFFESLAQDQRERAVGVVLSGTANDGTMGLEAIKAEGGITFAQDDSARHGSMPHSAVAAGCVDLILSPADISKELVRIASHPYVSGQLLTPATTPAQADQVNAEADGDREEGAGSDNAQNGYKKILLLLRSHSGVDFSLYKPATIQRRVGRRVVLNKQSTLDDYASFLRGNAKELDALYSDVLISVTSFFRNPETFDVLQHKILPELLKQRGDDPLRIWVLGCSSGQEAYSIAMAFVEAAEKAHRLRKLQVFATDLNEAMLEKARHGLYPKSFVADITPQRLQRFFVEADGGYRINKTLRDMVVFARQNLTADPPFSRVDLISCRNVLIYLEPSAQKKAMPTFHYALKPGGFLLLGASESIGSVSHFFEPVDRKHKIFSKKPASIRALHLPVRTEHGEEPPALRMPVPNRWPGEPEPPEASAGELNPLREADRITASQFAPPGVVVNAELQVLQFRGETGAFLEPPTGKPSFDVLKMARNGLMLPLRSAINQARKENKTARKENVRVKRSGKTRTVSLAVIPLKNLRERCFLILFEEAEKASGGNEPPEPQRARADRSPSAEKKSRIAELETELSETREYLQSLQERLETANEEFQASNEEVQSANEELQSSNEELETSKEELESTNEELTTVNEEMSNRNVELNRLNDDLVNLQAAAEVAIVLLERDLNIRRFGPYAEKQFDLQVSDLGRPIGHLRHNLVLGVLGDAPESALDLESLCAEVVSGVREQELEVRDKSGRWYSLRVRP
ncbi:MAG: CheR family methyltransferase, partial [Acidobacteriota bacterium]|nr:CheR family methyltransferase [Acidobacteriota bacterium]